MDNVLRAQFQIDILADIGMQRVAAIDDDGIAIGVEPARLIGMRPGIAGAGDFDGDFFAIYQVYCRFRL